MVKHPESFFVPPRKEMSNNESPLHNTLILRSLPQKRSEGTFCLLHQNIRGIATKKEKILLALNQLEEEKGMFVDCLCLTEHFVQSGEESNLNLTGFNLAAYYTRNRLKQNNVNRKGGCCIYISKGLEFIELQYVKAFAVRAGFECCGILLPFENLIIICIYRIPQSLYLDLFFEKLNLLLGRMSTIHKRKIILCGDFNIDITSQTRYLGIAKKFLRILKSYNFYPQIMEPTRITLKSKTCIDNIICNFNYSMKTDIHELALSDHTAQTLRIKIKRKPCIKFWNITKRDYSKSNIEKFLHCINALSFDDVYSEHNVDIAYSVFLELYKLFYDLCFPTIKVKIKNHNKHKWITKGIKVSSKVKRKIFIDLNYRGHKENQAKYNNYKCILKRCIKKSMKILNNRIINSATNKCKASWNIIKHYTGVNDSVPQTIKSVRVDDVTIADPQEIATGFNDYFMDSLPSVQTYKINNTYNSIDVNPSTMYVQPVTTTEVLNEIKSLKNTSSVGCDGICTQILKETATLIASPLTHIINLSIQNGVFPSLLKCSIIKPLYKKGDKEVLNNYRPVTLIPILAKVFERIMYKRLIHFSDKFNIIVNEQNGFRKDRSTSLAIFQLLKTIYECIDKRCYVSAVFTDMSKAFDCVCHDILLNKMERYGIRGKAKDWLTSYLIDRQQCTEVAYFCDKTNTVINKRSDYRVNNRGIPQGSILGPLLFLFYINDLPKNTNKQMVLFADDSTAIIKCEGKQQYERDINNTINNIMEWMNGNGLSINLTKTNIIQFHSYKKLPLDLKVSFNNINIEQVINTKFLGLILDSNCSWKVHIDSLCNRLSRFMYPLRKLVHNVSVDAALTAYFGYVQSAISYGIIFWGNAVDYMKVFKMQKRCIRAICGASQIDSCKPLFDKCKILPLPCLYIKEVAAFVHKHPSYFAIANDSNHRNLRYGYRIVHSGIHTSALYRKSFYVMSVKIYNCIPNAFKKLDYSKFKHVVAKWLSSKLYYSVQELFDDNGKFGK